MSKMIWRDCFTGTTYLVGKDWETKVKGHLIRKLSNLIDDDMQSSADKVASFWNQDYYQMLFPLRFGYQKQDGWIQAPDLLEAAREVDLQRYVRQRLRDFRLDGKALPPILPDEKKGAEGWLLVDRLLIEGALINVLLLDEGVKPEERHAARLAALTYPFHDELAKQSDLLSDDVVKAVSVVLKGGEAKLPDSKSSALKIVRAVRDKELREQYQVRLVMVAAQRIKKYVFDTPGLNEIRGGSTLLDQIARELRTDVIHEELGPEVVLREAGSTLVFLAPASSEDETWRKRLRQAFLRRTGAAFPAAASISVSLQELLGEYKKTMKGLHEALDLDRAQANQPLFMTLPFETRCDLCQTRAAEGWDPTPGLENIPRNRRPLCRVCKTKREVGRDQRKDKVVKVLDVLLDLECRNDVGCLGVGAKGDWMANDLEALIPPKNVRYKNIGIVYGDGNNFGAVSINLNDIALGLQWTARVSETTRAATALALGQATQKGAQQLGWQGDRKTPVLEKMPFQLLALGGDDISLFAWGAVALHFAAEFTRLTDLEFSRKGELCIKSNKEKELDPLTFSLGVLVTDSHTPVAKAVDFTEEVLLKWAKQAAKGGKHQSHLKDGTIAMLYAPTAESVPADLNIYRKQMYWLKAGNRLGLCMTLRPYTPKQLQLLLEIATNIVEEGNSGRLQRLVGAFYGAQQNALAGLLHYAYQRSRSGDDGWLNQLEEKLRAMVVTEQANPSTATLVKYPVTNWHPFGVKPEKDVRKPSQIWYSPLWDLLELVKQLS